MQGAVEGGGWARAREAAAEGGRTLARGLVAARGTGQNTPRATKLGVGKRRAPTRMVLWLKRKARADFLNNLLQVALGPAKI